MMSIVELSFCTYLEDSRIDPSTLVTGFSDWRDGLLEYEASSVAGLGLLLDVASFAKTL